MTKLTEFELIAIQNKINEGFTLRSLAKENNIDPGNLSRKLKENNNISTKTELLKITNKINNQNDPNQKIIKHEIDNVINKINDIKLNDIKINNIKMNKVPRQQLIKNEIVSMTELKIKNNLIQFKMLSLIDNVINQVQKMIKNNPSGFYVAHQSETGIKYGRNTEIIKDLNSIVIGINQAFNPTNTNVQINNTASENNKPINIQLSPISK